MACSASILDPPMPCWDVVAEAGAAGPSLCATQAQAVQLVELGNRIVRKATLSLEVG
jgi:hypothetical protein